jgi:hypothetical protein
MVAYSFKERFVEPIQVGLGILPVTPKLIDDPKHGYAIVPAVPPKLQTIRAVGRRRHVRPGEVIQLYYGMRTKQCRSIGVGRCTSVLPIKIEFVKAPPEPGSVIYIAGRPQVRGGDLDDFARRDGFADWSDMKDFWRKEHGAQPFCGLLIEWEKIT